MADLTVVGIDLRAIDASPRNPRGKLDRLDELTDSLRAYGLLQPIVVRAKEDGRYEVVAGHRRFAAASALGWQSIPAYVHAAEQDEAYLLTLTENLQRPDLTARDESRALEVLVRERGWSTRKVAAAVNRSASYVSRRLRVFEDTYLAPLVLSGALAVSVAEELLPLSVERKRDLAKMAVERGWDRGDLRAWLHGSQRTSQPVLRRAIRPGGRRLSLLALARQFRQGLIDADATRLSESERRELRAVFRELALLARAPSEQRERVFPPLPSVRHG
jgi:ParB/RepB/Spo0J family partition protein